MDAPPFAPLLQPLAQFGRQQNLPALALAADAGPVPLDRLHRDKPQFGHSDAGGTKRLQQQQRPLFACVTRCRQQPEILGAGQLPPRVGKNFALPLERFCLAARVMDGFLVHIDAGQQRVDRGGRVAAGAGLSAKKRARARVYFWMVAGLYSRWVSQAQ